MKIGKIASETLTILKMAYSEHDMKNLMFLKDIDSSRECKNMWIMMQEVDSQKQK